MDEDDACPTCENTGIKGYDSLGNLVPCEDCPLGELERKHRNNYGIWLLVTLVAMCFVLDAWRVSKEEQHGPDEGPHGAEGTPAPTQQ